MLHPGVEGFRVLKARASGLGLSLRVEVVGSGWRSFGFRSGVWC